MLNRNNLPDWPRMEIISSQNLNFVDINDADLNICICSFYNSNGATLEEFEDLAKVFIAAPKMLEAILRFQSEWVVNGSPAEKANNYTIEKQFQAAIENIFKS